MMHPYPGDGILGRESWGGSPGAGVLGQDSWGGSHGGGNHGVGVMVRESWDESPRAIEFLSVASSNTVNNGQ